MDSFRFLIGTERKNKHPSIAPPREDTKKGEAPLLGVFPGPVWGAAAPVEPRDTLYYYRVYQFPIQHRIYRKKDTLSNIEYEYF